MKECFVVLAAGKGVRLWPLTNATPKPFLKLGGKTIIERIIDNINQNFDAEIYINLHHGAEVALNLLEKWGYRNVNALVQDELRGPAGSLSDFMELMRIFESVTVISGDCYFDDDLRSLIIQHRECGNDVTFCLVDSYEGDKFGVVKSSQEGDVLLMEEKNPNNKGIKCQVSTGIYCLSPSAVGQIPMSGVYDFVDLWNDKKHILKFGTYMLQGGWDDLGTPDKYRSYFLKESAQNKYISEIDTTIINSFIHESADLGRHSIIKDSVVLRNSVIPENALIFNSIIGAEIKGKK